MTLKDVFITVVGLFSRTDSKEPDFVAKSNEYLLPEDSTSAINRLLDEPKTKKTLGFVNESDHSVKTAIASSNNRYRLFQPDQRENNNSPSPGPKI